ncbi:MAG: DUF4230 domain-containing protein [Bacteroides sp.]|nr:DUF4230 domain-containing protein [Bacteroides sp.]MBD5318184.1 DUF4230 domain-containing protein [Bacteroides sp.]MDE5826886.1 DUF4230 domain-containing protein [Duncaniella sp.]MDE6825117.1 DUF4230 domain-containing protein [Duncaniella sp.]
MIKKYFSLYVTGIILIVVLALGGGLYLWRSSTESTNMAISETKLSEIKDMLKLCTMEVRDDVAIKDSINGKWIFAKATVNGYIRFDLEKLDYQVKNDSVVIILPPEEIEIYESSANNSYEVIDTWNASMLDLRRMTAAEETAIKKRMARKYKASFYDKGYVKRARASAVETLSRLLSIIDPKITVIDPQEK